MTRCTRSVCLASSGRLAGDRDVCRGAGRRDEPVSSAQLAVTPARIKIAIVRGNLIASPSSAQATPMANRLAIIPKKTVQLKSFAIEESPLDSDVIALPEPPKAIDIRSPSVEGDRNDDPLFGLIAYFEGIALEIHPLHPPIDGLDSAPRLTGGAVTPGE